MSDMVLMKFQKKKFTGMERRGFSTEEIKALREAYKIIYRSSLNTAQAVEALEKKHESSAVIKELLNFIKESTRGIIK